MSKQPSRYSCPIVALTARCASPGRRLHVECITEAIGADVAVVVWVSGGSHVKKFRLI
jgi:hypothetical protein